MREAEVVMMHFEDGERCCERGMRMPLEAGHGREMVAPQSPQKELALLTLGF